jgi:hypothetical protein
MALTQAGAKFYIGVDVSNNPVPQNADLNQAGFEALTWLEVSQIGSVGETGTSTNVVSYDTLDTDVTQKGKGISNAGDPEIECARVGADLGQIAMRTAALTTDSYAFKYELDNSAGANGTTYYNRGLITGPSRSNGGNEDFDLETYTLGLNQREVVVEAA